MNKKIYLIESKIKVEANSGLEAIGILHGIVMEEPEFKGMEVTRTTCIYEPTPKTDEQILFEEIIKKASSAYTHHASGNTVCRMKDGSKIIIEQRINK